MIQFYSPGIPDVLQHIFTKNLPFQIISKQIVHTKYEADSRAHHT